MTTWTRITSYPRGKTEPAVMVRPFNGQFDLAIGSHGDPAIAEINFESLDNLIAFGQRIVDAGEQARKGRQHETAK